MQPVDLHDDQAAYLLGGCERDASSEYASSSVATPPSTRPEFLSPEPPKSLERPVPKQQAVNEKPKIRPTKAPTKQPAVVHVDQSDIPVLLRGGYQRAAIPENEREAADCSVSEMSSQDEKPAKKAGYVLPAYIPCMI